MSRIVLEAGWELRRVDADFGLEGPMLEPPAQGAVPRDQVFAVGKMPRQVHDVLLAAGVIENPNITGHNMDTWVGECDWVYSCSFAVQQPDAVWSLHLDGLDTFVDIWLNGKKIGSHQSAFSPCVLHGLVLQDENQLVLHFKAPQRILDAMELPEKYRGKVAATSMARVFRSGFHDYCGPKPSLIRMGVYAPIWLQREDAPYIGSFAVDAALNEGMDHGVVQLQDAVHCAACADNAGQRGACTVCERCTLAAELRDPNGEIVARAQRTGSGSMVLTVEAPRLWWPRSHGAPEVYTLHLSLILDGQLLDTAERVLGFRRVEMDESFALRVNGRPVRLWGANLAHPDTMSGCYNPERMEELLQLSVLGHFNCLRVWGESEIYPDAFYDACDRLGILLWQDFYHGYSMYSEEPDFVQLCRKEAESLVRRLRHHPSLLMWCGGNEMFLCRDYEFPGQPCLGAVLFDEVYPAVCQQFDPGRFYWPCSPTGGCDANDPLGGDTHGYTHLWFVPGAQYPVFASENCRVSAPAMRSMRRMMTEEELWPAGYTGLQTKDSTLPWPATWDAHNTNQGALKLGPVEQFYDADNAEDLVYRIGAAHALYIRRDVERFRRGRPDHDPDGLRRCYGHLLWRLNNNSNIISYGVVDYLLEPMMAYYALKRAYQPLLASFSIGDHIYAWLTNDGPAACKGKVVVRAYHLVKAAYTQEASFDYCLQADEAQMLGNLDVFGQFRREHVLVAQVLDEDGRQLTQAVEYLDMERRMAFPRDAKIEVHVEPDGTLVLHSDVFARSVELLGNAGGDEFGWLFEDNYFDLVPGEEKRVRVLGRHVKGKVQAKSHYSAVCTSVDWARGIWTNTI